jgi:hypothetical protein
MGKKRKPLVPPEERRRRIYRERNRILKAMGFASYRDYLEGDLWASIRTAVLKERPCCFACGRPAIQVHHRCYNKKVLEGRDHGRLFSVCRSCHHRIEFRDRDHEKLNPRQATIKLNQMATSARKRAEAEDPPINS